MIWFFDIDGTVIDNINKYYEAWYAYATNRGITWTKYDFKQYGIKNIFGPTSDVDIEDFETSEEFADFYIHDVFDGFVETAQALIQKGDIVRFLTSRNSSYRVALTPKIRAMFGDELEESRKTVSLVRLTEKWVSTLGLGDIGVVFADDKVAAIEAFSGRCICVDDTPEKINKFIEAGFDCLVKDAEYNRGCGSEGRRFSCWNKVLGLREVIINAMEDRKDWSELDAQECCAELAEENKALKAQNDYLVENEAALKEVIKTLTDEKEQLAKIVNEYRQKELTLNMMEESDDVIEKLKQDIEEKNSRIERLQADNKSLHCMLSDWVYNGLSFPRPTRLTVGFGPRCIGLVSVSEVYRKQRLDVRKSIFECIKKLARVFDINNIRYTVSGKSALLMYGIDEDVSVVTMYVTKRDIKSIGNLISAEFGIPHSIRLDTPEAAEVVDFSLDGIRVKITTGLRSLVGDNVIDNMFTEKSSIIAINGICVQKPDYLVEDARLSGNAEFLRKAKSLNLL